MATKIITRPFSKVYIGNKQVYPSLSWTNLNFDNPNTSYRLTQIDSWAWAMAVYWWTASTSSEWISGCACSYGTSIGVWWSSPTSPTSWPNWETTWWCLAVYAAWTWEIAYKQDIQLSAWSHTLTYKYQSKRAGSSSAYASANRCWVIINWVATYDTVTFNSYNSWKTRTVSFTMPSDWIVTISLWFLARNSGSASCPRVFFDDISIS